LGPNGFHRQFAGAQSARLRTELALAPERTLVMLGLVNDGPEPLVARLDAAVYGTPRKEFRLAPGARADEVIDVSSSRGWYDLRVSLEGATAYARHFAGRIENGQHSTSDPAMFGPAMGPSKFV
jgi:phospholipase C